MSEITPKQLNTLHEKLVNIQQDLKVQKTHFNAFGKYKYRNCEDILEALKPLLNGLTIILTDEIVNVGDRYYVKAAATLSDGKEVISNVAYARESLDKKGMDDSQITGSTSSYARKYALNGLFALDDTKDVDSQDNTKTEEYSLDEESIRKINEAPNLDTLAQFCKDIKEAKGAKYQKSLITLYTQRKKELEAFV